MAAPEKLTIVYLVSRFCPEALMSVACRPMRARIMPETCLRNQRLARLASEGRYNEINVHLQGAAADRVLSCIDCPEFRQVDETPICSRPGCEKRVSVKWGGELCTYHHNLERQNERMREERKKGKEFHRRDAESAQKKIISGKKP